jgi:hypothetical protein
MLGGDRVKLEKGNLKLDDYNLEHIQENINDGDTPIQALESELFLTGLKLEDVYSIEFSFGTKYFELNCLLSAELMNR